MTEQGVIHSPDRARQLILFEGCNVKNTKITPTDIDALIEYHDKTWILIEVKTDGKQVDQGQETMIRRFIADSAKAGKQSIYIIADHTITNPPEDIYLKDCIVRDICVYEDKNVNIRPPRTPNMTVKQCYDQWIDYIDTQKNE